MKEKQQITSFPKKTKKKNKKEKQIKTKKKKKCKQLPFRKNHKGKDNSMKEMQ